jgi:hypothetical protein
MEPGCTLLVYPLDVVLFAVRLDTTVADFYSDDGVTQFTARLASVLGVHAADLKLVRAFNGSAILQVMVRAAQEQGTVDETTGLTPLETL